ncbi:hypothetical protein [Synechococcus sp. Cruz CV12-2-Slac-r]|uniref:hypothetical protein n=1 Tax=Synechococcus sp. Cruz CV12-2-Slac-r TaxID=2823748 RepID=UPI0020CE6557|nr:hypothetical protein [Synechococcus sp. Cruz CV12-2-Slac-r]MCP9940238.1 hypothetical protein [Synechococcus sp. Cruz CV12-2-Slac-r]
MTTQLSNNDQTYSAIGDSQDAADLLSNDQESTLKGSDSQGSQTQSSKTQASQNQGAMTRAEASDTTAGVAGPASHSKDGLTEALKSERRRSNQLEKDLRGLKQQLNRFSEINPEEYSRLQEAERQKQLLEQQIELRERQMEEASSKKVLAAITERDGAQALVLALRKERLLERAFSEAEGRTGGDSRGTFFDVFKGQLDASFRLCTSKDINTPDSLEPLDGNGQPLLGEDGRPMSVNDFLDQLRIHPVYGFLFQQRGAISSFGPGVGPALAANPFGEVINPQSMTAAELYRASFASPTAKKRALAL